MVKLATYSPEDVEVYIASLFRITGLYKEVSSILVDNPKRSPLKNTQMGQWLGGITVVIYITLN